MIKIFAGICFSQGAFFGVTAWFMVDRIESLAAKSGISGGHPFVEAMAYESTGLYLAIIGAVLLSSAVFIWLGMKYSLDAVGAIYRFKKEFKKMATTRKLQRIKLRKNDYFRDLELAFNDMVDEVKPHNMFEEEVDIDEFTPTPTPVPTWKNKTT